MSFMMDWFDLHADKGTLKSFLQHHSSKASILQGISFFIVQLSHPYMTTGKDSDAGKRLKAGGERDNRGWDDWMASPTRLTGVWASSGSWWLTGKPGVLQSMGSQRVGHNWTNWLWRTVWRFPKELKMSYHVSEKTIIQKIICTPMFISALSTTAMTWRQPKCPWTD